MPVKKIECIPINKYVVLCHIRMWQQIEVHCAIIHCLH